MRVFSLVIIAVVLGVHAYFGFFDFRGITTEQLRTDHAQYLGKTIKLKNVFLTSSATKTLPEGDVLLRLNAANDLRRFSGKPPQDQPSVAVYARAAAKSSLAQELSSGGRYYYSELSVSVERDYLRLTEDPSGFRMSWFSTPYIFALRAANTFCSLQASVITAIIIQIVVVLAIVALVIVGVASVGLDFFD